MGIPGAPQFAAIGGVDQVGYDIHFIAALREVGYSGWLSTEVFDYTGGPKAIAEQSIAYLKKVINSVKRNIRHITQLHHHHKA